MPDEIIQGVTIHTSEAPPSVGAIADLQAENRRLCSVVEYLVECMAVLMKDHDHLAFPEPPKSE